MDEFIMTKNSDIIKSATKGLSLVKVDKEMQIKLNVAQKVFDVLIDDGCQAPYVLGDDLWAEFRAIFTKSN